MYLLNPKLWIALALAGLLAVTHTMAWRNGSAHKQAAWDAAKVIQQQALADAEKASRAKEQALQLKLTEAVNAAAKRTQQSQAAAAATRRVADSLRDELARSRAELSGASIASIRQRADTLTDVFGQCTSELTEMARRADALAIDRDTLIQAWPK